MPRKRSTLADTPLTDQGQLAVVRSLKANRDGAIFGPELDFWDSGETVVIGADEAGRGPLAGPVVTGAVAFKPETLIPGINDSKQLSASRREAAFDVIKQHALAWSIQESDAAAIDEHNILEATRLAMRAAVRDVAKQLDCANPVLLVDGRIPPLESGRQYNIVKGDSLSFSIGAASILAKVHRDRLMHDYDAKYPGYGFAQHKGYPTLDHRLAVLQLGRCPIHRLTFTIASRNGDRISIGALPEWSADE
ncbi:ribonuclease HII [bacterium]|nr:ribonuclease HII [bacterium]